MSTANFLPKLIPQRVHDEVNASEIDPESGDKKAFFISQRDCVENLVRNTCALAFLTPDGGFRPEVQSKIQNTHLHALFYSQFTPEERVSDDQRFSALWLDCTHQFERFGVIYDPSQGGREVDRKSVV